MRGRISHGSSEYGRAEGRPVRFFAAAEAGLFAFVLLCGCASPRAATDLHDVDAESAAENRRLPFPGARSGAPFETNFTPNVVSYSDYRDPLIGLNRAVFAFNDVAYRYILIPLAKSYTWITPDPVERRIGNVFYNIKMPIYAVNHLLQLKPARSGRNLLRFGINSTIGLLGLFDPADAWFGLEREETHLDDTLAGYGMGYGIYLVLPVFGPSDVRSGLSTVGDFVLNPVPYLTEYPLSAEIQSFDYLQDFAPGADRYRTLRNASDDPYLFFRNLHLQGVQRDADY